VPGADWRYEPEGSHAGWTPTAARRFRHAPGCSRVTMSMSGDAQIGSICVPTRYEHRTAAGKQIGGSGAAVALRSATFRDRGRLIR
jgi:hypothetical protein